MKAGTKNLRLMPSTFVEAQKMRRRCTTLSAIIVATALCLSTTLSARAESISIGVILPDASASARWESTDRPILAEQFAAAGVTALIQNANGDKAKFLEIADSMLAQGVKVLIMAGLDSSSTAAVQEKARKKGVRSIDYVRLTQFGTPSFYLAYNNVSAGRILGKGIVSCLNKANKKNASIMYLNGGSTDPVAMEYRKGYDSVLRPFIKSGSYRLISDQSVPNWDYAKSAIIFEQQFAKVGGKLDAVVAANEGLALVAIDILKKRKFKGKICISGQDATVEGLAAVLTGDISVSVYRPIQLEAKSAAELAINMLQGKKITSTTGFVNNGKRGIPAILLEPVTITKANVKDVIADGFQKRSDICRMATEAICVANGI
jgi:D-xylose transport system substrate-binding protein